MLRRADPLSLCKCCPALCVQLRDPVWRGFNPLPHGGGGLFASSLALDSKRHISINLFVRKLSRYNQLRLELLFQICMLAFLVLLMINGSILLPQPVDGLHPHHAAGIDVLVLSQHSGWVHLNGDLSNQKPR